MSKVPHIKIVFFGSTSDSILVLEKLFTFYFLLFTPRMCAVVTQPPRPIGRKQIMTPTPVETWARAHGIPVMSFASDRKKPWLYEDEIRVIDALQPLKADLLVSACFGQKIPWEAIKNARLGGLNVHPSLLPRWRGADPVPWAILCGDRQTGVTIVTLSKEFDEGAIIAQKKLPITNTDTSNPLRTKLFTIGAKLLVESFDAVIASEAKQSHTNVRSLRRQNGLAMTRYPYARRLTREDGFESWEAIVKAFTDPQEAARIDRKFRAFHPWPGLWTLLRQGYGGQAGEKRLKILDLTLSNQQLTIRCVQLEGKKPVTWEQFRDAYLPS